jgi:hypothetical protein
MIDPIGIEKGSPAFYPVDHITLLQEKFCEIGAVLARDACY